MATETTTSTNSEEKKSPTIVRNKKFNLNVEIETTKIDSDN